VVLVAIAGALRQLLSSRGEAADRFVVSVPISSRREAGSDQLGNQVGAVPIAIPAAGDFASRLDAVAEATREAKGAPRGASSAILGPVFRLLARVGLFGWFVDRQALVNTFVTNLRGPDVRLTLAGAPIAEIVALTGATGNVTVSFAVLSYDGILSITVISDPDTCPDVDVLTDALAEQLDILIAPPRGRAEQAAR
jgi:diacylglycerol O-acyltransferase